MKQNSDIVTNNLLYPTTPTIDKLKCSCGTVYVGETQRALVTRIREHQDACRLCNTEKSAVAVHAWEAGHSPDSAGVKILDTASRKKELLVKKAIQLTPSKQLLNCDSGWQYQKWM